MGGKTKRQPVSDNSLPIANTDFIEFAGFVGFWELWVVSRVWRMDEGQ